MEDDGERVLSVFELAQGLKRTVETATAGRWVEGEVGRLQRPTSGHVYFTLKDESRDAAVDCVMYKREAMRFGARLLEGGRVQLRGRATFYPPRGRLQWIAEVARAAGQGALLEALEQLKKKLIAEGLTDPERKRELPSAPRVVGVITSKTGAAFSDICTVAARRGNVRLLLCSAIVQGDQAPRSILRALDLMERAAPDVVILGRGGGSAEDLMAFNDEQVVRRVAGYSIPIVSAVGHEIDISLTDLVADARAATPSQAAEMVVADARSRLMALSQAKRHLAHAMRSRVISAQLELGRARNLLSDPRFLLADGQQALDEMRTRLEKNLRRRLVKMRETSTEKSRRLYARHPRAVIAHAQAHLAPLRQRLQGGLRRNLDARHAELNQQGHALSALSPLSILGRGFALATAADGRAVRDVDALELGAEVTVRVRRGSFLAKVTKVLSTVENHRAFDHESPGSSVEPAGDQGS